METMKKKDKKPTKIALKPLVGKKLDRAIMNLKDMILYLRHNYKL